MCRHDVGKDDPSDNLENAVRHEKIPSPPIVEDDGMIRQTSKMGKKRGKDNEAVVIGSKLSKPAPDQQMSMKKTSRTVASPSSIPAPLQQLGPDQPPPLNVPLNERQANPSKEHVDWQVAEQICNGSSCGWCQMDKGQEFLHLCSVCLSVAYCGPKCQRKSWPTHKKICKKMPGVLWDVKVKLVCSVIELSRVKLKRKSQDYQEDAAAKRCKQSDCEPIQSQQKEALLPPNQSISETQLPIDYKEPLQSKDAARPQQMESPVHDDNPCVFAKFICFPYWPAKVISKEGSGVNVLFPDGSTSGSGGAVRHDKILPFDKKSAESIVKMTRFKSGHHSIKEFKKACEKFGLQI